MIASIHFLKFQYQSSFWVQIYVLNPDGSEHKVEKIRLTLKLLDDPCVGNFYDIKKLWQIVIQF